MFSLPTTKTSNTTFYFFFFKFSKWRRNNVTGLSSRSSLMFLRSCSWPAFFLNGWTGIGREVGEKRQKRKENKSLPHQTRQRWPPPWVKLVVSQLSAVAEPDISSTSLLYYIERSPSQSQIFGAKRFSRPDLNKFFFSSLHVKKKYV